MVKISVFLSNREIGANEAIGFFSNGFGEPIAINQFNLRTFITNTSGTANIVEGKNCRPTVGLSGVITGQVGSGISLLNLPNYQATMNIRLTNDTAISVQDARLYVHSSNGIDDPPSGINVHTAEIVHPSTSQEVTGIGDSVWLLTGGSGSVLGLVNSPGISGLVPNDLNQSTRHDWFVAFSVSPQTPNPKSFHFTFACEYL